MAFRVSIGKPPAEPTPPVRLIAAGDDDRTRNINLLSARRSPAFDFGVRLLHQAVGMSASMLQLDCTERGVSLILEVDGIHHSISGVDFSAASALAQAYKQLAGLSVAEQRWRQSGQFKAVIDRCAWTCHVVSTGLAGGERIIVTLGGDDPKFANLASFSIREKSLQLIRQALSNDAGLILFSAPPDSGIDELLETAVRDTDRFLRSFCRLESSRSPRPQIENVTTTKYDGVVTFEDSLRSVLRKHPDVLIIPDLSDAEMVDAAADFSAGGGLALAGIAANSAPEALLRALALRCDAQRFSQNLSAVANARFLRRLCVTCRQPYMPPPQILAELGIPADQSRALFRPSGRISGERDEPIPCPGCRGLGYRGRLAIAQWMEVNEDMRQSMLADGIDHLAELHRLAAADGMTSLMHLAGALAAAGETSVQEIYRVLRARSES